MNCRCHGSPTETWIYNDLLPRPDPKGLGEGIVFGSVYLLLGENLRFLPSILIGSVCLSVCLFVCLSVSTVEHTVLV